MALDKGRVLDTQVEVTGSSPLAPTTSAIDSTRGHIRYPAEWFDDPPPPADSGPRGDRPVDLYLRRIIDAQFARVRCNPGQGSYLLTLDCGHLRSLKASEVRRRGGLEKPVFCAECAQRAGATR